jgi:hypothetical protein
MIMILTSSSGARREHEDVEGLGEDEGEEREAVSRQSQ